MTTPSWVRFWSTSSWRDWWVRRSSWRHYTDESRRLRREISQAEQHFNLESSELARVNQQRSWAAGPDSENLPIRTARSETGIGSVDGVALLEIRKKDGKEVWTQVDRGSIHFTDRKFVFSGRKNVKFRLTALTANYRVDEGLYLAVSSRRRVHVLAGPVDRISTLITASQSVAGGLSATAPFDKRVQELTGSVHRIESSLAESRGATLELAKPARPISPAWVPGALLVALVAFAGSGGPSAADTVAVSATMASTTVAPTTTTTTAPTTASTTAAPTTTTRATTTTIRTAHSFRQSDVLLADPVAGASGDPGSPLPAGADVVTVVSVTDGDTVDVRYLDGTVAPVRLIGINSPETNECFSEEAAMVLAVLAPVGTRVGMTVDLSDEDQYGRLLRYLWRGSMSVNEEAIRRGAAIARRYAPDTALAERLEAAQAEAAAAHLGLWAPEACGPRADASVNIIQLLFDPDGDDNQNLNEEWIQIRNEGDNLVDLGGWVIKDESASNRFEFPPSFSLVSGEAVTIRSGCGEDFGTYLFWCSVGSAIWNNDGDTAFLLDPYGNIHDTYSYAGVATTTQAPSTTTQAPAAPVPIMGGGCDPSYPDVCIPPYPPDLDCGEISYTDIRVVGNDPHGFDGDNDGIGCES